MESEKKATLTHKTTKSLMARHCGMATAVSIVLLFIYLSSLLLLVLAFPQKYVDKSCIVYGTVMPLTTIIWNFHDISRPAKIIRILPLCEEMQAGSFSV